MPDLPSLSVVIVNWNTRDLLAQCLQSIAGDDPFASFDHFELFVVDNASADGSAAMVRQRFPWVCLIENEANVGFAAANNQALRICRGRYVLLLNPDTVIHPGALHALVGFMAQRPAIGAAGARLTNADGSLQLSCQPSPTLFREAWMLLHLDKRVRLGSYDMDVWDTRLPRQVDVVKGACLIAPRYVLQRVGLLDESYFLYAEELDLCERIRRAGYEVYWVPAAVVTHLGQRSTAQQAEWAFLQLHASKHRFLVTHRGRWSGIGYLVLLIAAALPRILLGALAPLRRKEDSRTWVRRADLYRRLVRSLLSRHFAEGPLRTAFPTRSVASKES